jgi:F0F1-type ATP synthase assembly protein I
MDPQKVALSGTLYRLSCIGINLGACVLVGLGLGLLCRRYFHWGDWVVIFWIVIGVISGFTETIRELRRLNKDDKEKKPHGA